MKACLGHSIHDSHTLNTSLRSVILQTNFIRVVLQGCLRGCRCRLPTGLPYRVAGSVRVASQGCLESCYFTGSQIPSGLPHRVTLRAAIFCRTKRVRGLGVGLGFSNLIISNLTLPKSCMCMCARLILHTIEFACNCIAQLPLSSCMCAACMVVGAHGNEK